MSNVALNGKNAGLFFNIMRKNFHLVRR